MKKIISILCLVLITTSLNAQAPKVDAKKGSSFGEKVTTEGTVPVDDITALLKDSNTAEVKVIGKVADVCTAKGCFLYLVTSTGKIYVKTKDDSFFVPTKLNGKKVIVKGIVEKDKDSKEISIQATGILVI